MTEDSSHRRYSRRSALALLAAGALTSCGRRGADRESERVVNLYNWYDYLAPQVLEDFTARTGIAVHYETFDSNQTLEAKLLAGSSGYDVVFPSAATLRRFGRAGVLQPLDRTQLPHLGNLDPLFVQRLADYDVGNRLALPYTWGITGLGIDVARVRALLPEAALDSWSLLLDPAQAARLAACGIGLYDSPTIVFPSTLAWLGLAPTADDPLLLDQAGAALDAIRAHVRKVTQGSLVEDLGSGELCVVIASDGDVRQARERARLAGRNVELQFVAPREGATLWFDVMAIPIDAPHAANAHRFIDFMLEAAPAAANSAAIGFANGNAASQELLPVELRNATLFPTGAAASRMFAEIDHDEAYVRRRTRLWTRFRTGR